MKTHFKRCTHRFTAYWKIYF